MRKTDSIRKDIFLFFLENFSYQSLVNSKIIRTFVVEN